MAAGTITYPYKRGVDVRGHSKMCPVQYVGPASYVAGGDANFTAGKVKLGTIEWVIPMLGIAANGLSAVMYAWNPTTEKLQAFWSKTTPAGAFPEVTDGTDLTGFSAILLCYGKG